MTTLKLYCAGGAGLNIGKQFAKMNGRSTEGYAQIDSVFIDTSRSNISPEIPGEQIYLVPELDGSGKRRATNYAAISEAANEILHSHRPGDINVVMHSAGGGSGSVIGPLLVSELLHRGERVLVVLIGSTSSRIETENTKKTIQSYEAVSSKRSRPVNVFYRENGSSIGGKEMTRSTVDASVAQAIMLMSLTFSNGNRELDSEDIKNFLDYQNVTSYSPKLSFIDFWSKEIDVDRGQSIVSVVTLVTDEVDPQLAQLTDYQAVGYITEEAAKNVRVPLPLHAAVITGYFNPIVAGLDKKLGEYTESRSVTHDKSILAKGTDSTDEGLVL
jgi:hypothetical protein